MPSPLLMPPRVPALAVPLPFMDRQLIRGNEEPLRRRFLDLHCLFPRHGNVAERVGRVSRIRRPVLLCGLLERAGFLVIVDPVLPNGLKTCCAFVSVEPDALEHHVHGVEAENRLSPQPLAFHCLPRHTPPRASPAPLPTWNHTSGHWPGAGTAPAIRRARKIGARQRCCVLLFHDLAVSVNPGRHCRLPHAFQKYMVSSTAPATDPNPEINRSSALSRTLRQNPLPYQCHTPTQSMNQSSWFDGGGRTGQPPPDPS
jgi:hypothetical protein